MITGKKGDAYEEVVGLVSSLRFEKEVIFAGYVPLGDLPVLLSGAEALLFPSIHEGFGLPVIEAMACGCPVVTSNCSALPEVSGDAALLIDPHNEAEIAAAIERVVVDKDLRSCIIAKGFKRAAEFSWKKTAEDTLKVFESLNGQPNGTNENSHSFFFGM